MSRVQASPRLLASVPWSRGIHGKHVNEMSGMSWQRTMAGRGRLAVFVTSAAMIAACSGSSDDTAPATSAALDETSNDTHDDVTETSDVKRLSHTERLEVTPPKIVDPDGEDRCDRLGYPCSWSDVPESDFERSRQLWIDSTR